MNTKQVLLDIAKQDLEAAKSLYEKKLYPQAVFYLEQAVEKATKSMGLYQNVISEDELKDIGHESIEIYVKVVEGLKNKLIRFQDRIKQFPKLKHTTLFKEYENLSLDKFDDMLNNFEFYIKHPDRQISETELEKTIFELTKLETEIESQKITIEKDEIENFKPLFREVADVISEQYPASKETIEEELKKLESVPLELMEELMGLSIIQAICNNHLLFLSAISCPHAVSSRYPYPKYEHNPLTAYTGEHPLIKRFDQITRIIKGVLDKMSKLFSQDSSDKLKLLSKPTGG